MRLAVSCSSQVSSRPHDMHRAVKRAVHSEMMTAWHASTVLVSHPVLRLSGPHVRTPVVARGLGGECVENDGVVICFLSFRTTVVM